MYSGVTDGTVITVTVLDATSNWWQQLAKQDAEQFFSLARAGGGTIDGQQYTKQQCYIKVLENNDRNSDAWFGLAVYCRGGNVGGQQYSSQQCYVKSMEVDPDSSKPRFWNCLGYTGGGSVDGQQYTKQQCFIKAQEIANGVTVSGQ